MIDEAGVSVLDRRVLSLEATLVAVERERDAARGSLACTLAELREERCRAMGGLGSGPFDEPGYLALNRARRLHLAGLGLPLAGATALELGAGVGDMTPLLLDAGALVTTSDARPENVARLRARYPKLQVETIDVEEPVERSPFDVVLAAGLLYHLSNPARALDNMAGWCAGVLIIETCVVGDGEPAEVSEESPTDARDGVRGWGVRLSRRETAEALRVAVGHAYFSRNQPDHGEFPLDWTRPLGPGLHRAVLVGSRRPLSLPTLVSSPPMLQEAYRG